MTHPDLEHAVAFGRREILDAIEQSGMAVRSNLGIAELAMRTCLNLPALLHRHREHAVANAQHRHAKVPDRLRRAQILLFVGAGMAAGQDDASKHLPRAPGGQSVG